MNEWLRTIEQQTDRLFIAIEDQIARPLGWALRKSEERRVANSQTQQAEPISPPADEWEDEKANPLHHWRWA